MKIQTTIQKYLQSLPATKRIDLEALHHHLLQLLPNSKLWFFDGTDESGKIVTNPNIGYGHYTINYANGKTRDFYQIGISANTSGISVYIMGIAEKNYLTKTYEKSIGKAKVTSYCIKFKTIKDINLKILDAAILDGIMHSNPK